MDDLTKTQLDPSMHPRIFAKLRFFDYANKRSNIVGETWGSTKVIHTQYFTDLKIRNFLDFPLFRNPYIYYCWDYVQQNIFICDLNALRLFNQFIALAHELYEREKKLRDSLIPLRTHGKSDEYIEATFKKRKKRKEYSPFFMEKTNFYNLEKYCRLTFASFIGNVTEVVLGIYFLELPYDPWKPPKYLESLVALVKLIQEHKRRKRLPDEIDEEYRFQFNTIFLESFEGLLFICHRFFKDIKYLDYTKELSIDPIRIEVIQKNVGMWFAKLVVTFDAEYALDSRIHSDTLLTETDISR